MRELSDDECMAIAGPECTVLSSFGYELVRAAYAAGYAAAQSGPLDHQPAATPSPATSAAAFPVAAQAVTDGPAADHQRETTSNDWGAMMEASKRAAYEAASAVTEGPAADPIDNLCARLYSLAKPHTYMLREEAAVVIERLRVERDEARRECVEQARLLGMSGSREAALIAERDTLAAIVRAAWKEES